MELLTTFGRSRSKLMSVGVNDVVSKVNDRILEIWDPRLRCTPEHSACQRGEIRVIPIHSMTARLIEHHSVLVVDPQSAQVEFD